MERRLRHFRHDGAKLQALADAPYHRSTAAGAGRRQ